VIKKTSGGDLVAGILGHARQRRRAHGPVPRVRSQIPAETKTRLDTLKAAIADGSIKVCTFLGKGCS
jgi:hypothetical protein